MLERCNHSMHHWEHMCSLTENGCPAMEASAHGADFFCVPCNESHRHHTGCTSSYIGA